MYLVSPNSVLCVPLQVAGVGMWGACRNDAGTGEMGGFRDLRLRGPFSMACRGQLARPIGPGNGTVVVLGSGAQAPQSHRTRLAALLLATAMTGGGAAFAQDGVKPPAPGATRSTC